MATLLDGVNRVLIKVGELESRATLTTLTDSARQVFIDTAIDSWNETIDELYLLTRDPRPKAIKQANLTLVQDQREYRLHSTVVSLRTDYHLIDETNNHTIQFLENAHRSLVFGDIEQDDTGLPSCATLNPENNKIMFDRDPDANAAGRVYVYRFEREILMDDATDVFPFNDTVFRALVPAVAEKWKFENRQGGSLEVYNKFLAQAASRLRSYPWRDSWAPRRVGRNNTDPFVDVA